MSPVKKIFDLLISFIIIVVIVEAQPQCDFGTGFVEDFNAAEFAGSWYLIFAYPDIFKPLHNAVIHMELEDNVYDSYVAFSNETDSYRYDGKYYLTVSNSTFYALYPDLYSYTGTYQVKSTDYKNYMILRGCPLGGPDDGIYEMFFRQKSPDKSALLAAIRGLQDVNLNFRNFIKDPTEVVNNILGKIGNII